MDLGPIGDAVGYFSFFGLGIGLPLHSYFKYVRKTALEKRGQNPVDLISVDDDRRDFLIEQENSRRHAHTLEQRVQVATEMIKSGKQTGEISSFIDTYFPFPATINIPNDE